MELQKYKDEFDNNGFVLLKNYLSDEEANKNYRICK